MLPHATSIRQVHPMSYAQQRLWVLDRLQPGVSAYNVARVIRIRGGLSAEAIRQTLRGIVSRHESLRTTFTEIDGEPVQVVTSDLVIDVPTVDLDDLPEPAREAQALRLARDDAERPFDLTSGPLIRARLLRVHPDAHILVLVLHHIVTDGWSMSVLFDEIGRLYEACAAGRPSPLPDPPIQYGQFARWERESHSDASLASHLAYWRTRLAGVEPVLPLPLDRPRPAVSTARGQTERVDLPAEVRDRLEALARSANATLFMVLLAAFQTLLARWTGCDDVVVGSPVATRSRTELERSIGLFVNTLVLRADLSGDPTFLELLARVREVALEAFAHQEVPFEKLVETLKPPRSVGSTPLFQVMFILQNMPRQRLELPGLILEELEIDTGTAKFDLTAELAEADDGLTCAFEYSTDLFEHDTVTRMLRHYRTLLESVASDPGQRLSALPMMTADERHRILVEWNDTAASYPRHRCIHELFDEQVDRSPDAIALGFRGERISYRALEARANQLAHRLRRSGVGPGVLVGIFIERSIDAVVALLAILKAGGAYVPLDPTYPGERISFMLDDSRARVLLTLARLADRMPTTTAEVIQLDTDRDRLALEPTGRPDCGAVSEDLAYAIYTSGSTGNPKAVLGCHRASVNRFSWMWAAWPFAPDEVLCQKTALSFVDSVWEVFGPLLQGVPSVIVPDEDLEDPNQLVHMLAANRVTRIVLVPSWLRLLLDRVPELGSRLPDLHLWVTSGEAITPDLAYRFADAVPGATLLNLYGSSEVAGDVTAHVVRGARFLARVPIGRPIANTRIYILDRASNPVPIGVAGEIHVSGDNVARGYLNNPELTARTFIPDAFAADPGVRLYRTGDLGRFLPDGNIEFLGRVDTQVKIRGVRIEPGEIEVVLRDHPAVRTAAVVVSGAEGDERLIAFVVPAGAAPAPAHLRGFLRAKLPEAMVPAAFVVLEGLPLSPSGKVDRQALVALTSLEPHVDQQYVPPRSATEERLAAIMAEVLKLDRVGVHDDFFDLGGHSLLAMQVVARVRNMFSVELPLRALFEEPNVAGLAPKVEKAPRCADTLVDAPLHTSRRMSNRVELLQRLEQLSDEEVSTLLNTLGQRRVDEREAEEF